ncbi:MAG TPA: lysylphosphatidylglycerol synthase transmembrane domain-containing protein [Xanthobacteraceae bacterium]|nr:lysylphosphatidylglycerol synthase transmembrane domain-containing protein [Xanthobacteraceae bacterium]
MIALKVVATGGLLWFALGRIDWAVVGLRLNTIVPLFGIAALIVLGLQPLLSALRWRLIAGHSGFNMSVAQACRLNLIGTFFNQTLPSSLGGDGARIWLLVKGGTAPSAATYSVLLDRVMGVLWLIILAVACLPWSLAIVSNSAGRMSLIVCALGGLAAIGVFLSFGKLDAAWSRRWWATRHAGDVSRLAWRLLSAPAPACAIAVLSLTLHAATVGAVWLIAQGVGAPLGIFQALIVVPPILLIATVPISIGGWGVRESAMAVAFSFLGLAETDGVIVSVLLGAGMFIVGAAGGLVWIATAQASHRN